MWGSCQARGKHTHAHTHTQTHTEWQSPAVQLNGLSTQDKPVGGAVKGKAF